MKLSKRETVLIIILLFVMSAAAYYFFWFMPKMEQISKLDGKLRQMELDIEDAISRNTQFEILTKSKQDNTEQWEELLGSIPRQFDEADIIERINKYFSPYTTEITIEFPDESLPLARTEILPVIIRFSVTHDILTQILTGFENDDTQIRVINYESELIGLIDDRQLLDIAVTAEYLVMTGDTPADTKDSAGGTG